MGLEDVDDRIFATQSAHRWRWASHLYAPAALVLISVRGWVNPGHSAAGRIRWIEKNTMALLVNEPATFQLVA
jgi:hypothetical protein